MYLGIEQSKKTLVQYQNAAEEISRLQLRPQREQDNSLYNECSHMVTEPPNALPVEFAGLQSRWTLAFYGDKLEAQFRSFYFRKVEL